MKSDDVTIQFRPESEVGNADVAGGLSTGLDCHLTVGVTVNFSTTAFKAREMPPRKV